MLTKIFDFFLLYLPYILNINIVIHNASFWWYLQERNLLILQKFWWQENFIFCLLGKIWNMETGLCNQLIKIVNFNLFFEIRLTSKLSFLLQFLSLCYFFSYPALTVFQLLIFWTCFFSGLCRSCLIFCQFSHYKDKDSFLWALIDFV